MLNRQRNHLANETSPYLQQHADNPVDWYPWGNEALTKAQQENKPILLSIGYSACHWCHVMAHESFEDAQTAEIMNQGFVNIKVDREERPDLDKIYQLSYQLLTQRGGGWPLTMFLTPDKHIPFMAGTYFPHKARQQMPAFKEVLKYVIDIFQQKHAEIESQGKAFTDALASLQQQADAKDIEIDETPLFNSRRQLEQDFDHINGGFTAAPKFPNPPHLERLLHHWQRNPEDSFARTMLEQTLTKMAQGGLYDQLGGGFFRYCVDEHWEIPHFEKMLYDNGQLLFIYAQAAALTGSTFFKTICFETAKWVLREMQSPQGGFFSSLDADTEGVEGKFYLWDKDEIKTLLNKAQYQAVVQHYGLDSAANFEGKWHLKRASTVITDENLAAAQTKLLKARAKRTFPGRDEKILTAWNGLMIKGMAMAGDLFSQDEFLDAAEKSIDFIHECCWVNGRLMACFKDGRARLMGYLDDYVFMIDAILAFLQARWRTKYLHFANALAEVILTHFQDKKGGFYYTADDHEELIYRPKNIMDEAIPAGNGIAATVLIKLGYLLGETKYLEAAEATIKAAWGSITKMPTAHQTLLMATEALLHPAEIIIIRGDPKAMTKWQQQCSQNYQLNRLVFAIPKDETNLPPALMQKKPQQQTVAYICQGHTCSPPIDKLTTLCHDK